MSESNQNANRSFRWSTHLPIARADFRATTDNQQVLPLPGNPSLSHLAKIATRICVRRL